MSLPRNIVHANTLPTLHGRKLTNRSLLALVLPITLAAGCASGPNSRNIIIDYTVSESEYNLAMNPPEAAPQMVAAAPAAAPQLAAAAPAAEPQLDAAPIAAEPLMGAAMPPPTLAARPPYLPETRPYLPMPLPNQPLMAEAPALVVPAFSETAFEELDEEPEIAGALGTQTYSTTPGFGKSVYAAIGIGASRLNPDTSAIEGWTTDDSIAGAGQVTLGVDLAKRVSLEVHSADYGSAGLTPEGRINYHLNGASALFYVGKNLDTFRRRGLSGYARVGYSQLENTPVGNIPFISQTAAHPSFGLGAEYNTRIGLGLRADVIAYGGDVQTGQLAMLYRMGKKPKRAKLAMADTGGTTTTTTTTTTTKTTKTNPPASIPLLGAALPASGNTSDVSIAQIMNQQKAFANPTHDACTALNGTLTDVNFFNGSNELTPLATNTLDKIAVILNGCNDLSVIVSAHTDSSGSAIANNTLSKNRARKVAKHLANQGVSLNRLRPVAYGESSPIATNSTPDGRMRNRRVEIEVR